ncbi:bifunctional DNA-formamidopyrimidine glycosylase/DNA-(apurinic or apyrimidinic site) lyase [Natronosporangium hydrolyticum]|uniref:Formamidopyrimidine-DNA glycosylase n=1 Tax=Natronosporangium hydrolyticum TaxID=2811111 RepID=A0A895YIH2_9ACTN|nr:bifunctional DNA-formamidopyrimidine glycosylase/DNA-(apurinic or apyrimidinic site) lyase [Natronosporangium hydrolyticum]QSB13558.1 bifunctional DNA-formamidopyrimidine glycosylase/DNA-(apurinic or apyrimidinic site) lyase [Natronosporangium hydrolyticum]
MPELPEVETVRIGLADRVVGQRINAVEVRHPRAVRRHLAGADDFVAALTGQTLCDVHRRGKYLWLPLDGGDALVGHLGMSGQLLLPAPELPESPHLRVRFSFAGGGRPLCFVDQRTFGGLSVSPFGRAEVPDQIAHIAPDPLDKAFSDDGFVAALRRRRVAVKAALLDQSLISGVGNIYADEALWRSRLHGQRRCDTLTGPVVRRLLGHVRDVLDAAVRAGGTSFDALYVNVNGESGWFSRSLDAYGREGLPCHRCGAAIRREPFTNRSSFSCPRCQPRPRSPRL